MGVTTLKDALAGGVADIAKNAAASPAGTHADETGLLVCDTCGMPKQHRITVPGREEPLVVPVMCSCEEREREERERREAEIARKRRAENARRECFTDSPTLVKCTFDASDKADERIANACKRYADTFAPDDPFGLLLYGGVGGGKTYMASAIANRVIDLGYTALQTDMGSIVTLMESSFEKRHSNLARILDYDLLVLDDLGAQRSTEYVMQQVYAIIDGRYRRGKPMVITTNLDMSKLRGAATSDMWPRIADRVLEVCYPIEFDGNRRVNRTLHMREAMRDRVGI